jgi:hypothetical protein
VVQRSPGQPNVRRFDQTLALNRQTSPGFPIFNWGRKMVHSYCQSVEAQRWLAVAQRKELLPRMFRVVELNATAIPTLPAVTSISRETVHTNGLRFTAKALRPMSFFAEQSTHSCAAVEALPVHQTRNRCLAISRTAVAALWSVISAAPGSRCKFMTLSDRAMPCLAGPCLSFVTSTSLMHY